jgi:hypothetical protein
LAAAAARHYMVELLEALVLVVVALVAVHLLLL